MGQKIAGLAVKFTAQGIKRRKPDGAGLSGLQNRQVGHGHTDPICQFGQ